MSFLLRAIGREQMWQALVLFSAILVIVQFLLMLIAPGYAFHSASDIGVAEHAGRFRGVFFHKNEAARFGLVALIIILVTKKRFSKITWIVLLCCAASTLGATQSSKAIVALVASVSALWYMKLRIAPATKFIIALTCLVGAILIYSFIGFEDIIVGVAETLGRDATLSGRDVVWQLAFDQIKEKPLLGGGFHAGWPQSATDYLVKLKGPTGGLSHAHNGYLQLLLDIGVIGLLLTMLPSLFLIGSLFSVHPDDSDEIANFSVLFVGVYFTLNLAGSYLLSGNDIFHWLILFSVICLRNVPKLKK
ncbi:O-antigen ligase family protein [Phaeobacter sp. CNT1-3]|nr:O-antigen ligase family protein [Phaeobacter sp. CNT1-3]